MKRGRPAMRAEFRREILNVLGHGQYEYSATASAVRHLLEARRMRKCGWDTVRKYLDELAAERLVLRQALPTHAGRKPLVVYVGRCRPNR